MAIYCQNLTPKELIMDSNAQTIIEIKQQAIALRNLADALINICTGYEKQNLNPAQQNKVNVRATILDRAQKSYHHKKLKKNAK